VPLATAPAIWNTPKTPSTATATAPAAVFLQEEGRRWRGERKREREEHFFGQRVDGRGK
jgi:hypothetical protein